MATDFRAVLATLYAVLDLGPPPADPAEVEEFELDDAVCRVEPSPSGLEVLISVPVGTLATDPHLAAERLRRLMRLSLGLALVNRAALVCDERPDESRLRALQSPDARTVRPLTFRAVAVIAGNHRAEVVGALQDVLQLRSLAHDYVAEGGPQARTSDPSPRADRPVPEDGGSMIIFQP